jgi:3-methyladenine DNA glycosylase/8-oxoguanine DNA glycosylase
MCTRDSIALKLEKTFSFPIRPIPPYDFKLTVRKPAGWDLFNSQEIYENKVLWSVARIGGRLAGLRIRSLGSVERPRMVTTVFTKEIVPSRERTDFRSALEALLGANDDLSEFYAFARKDPILSHAVKDLYGMHDTQPASLFNSVVLSICLQMAKLERSNRMMEAIDRSYGDKVEFDGRRLTVQPTAEKIAKLNPKRFAKECNLGYRANYIVGSAKTIAEGFPDIHQIMSMPPERAKETLMELPGVGDYAADIINPHGGFPIDAWSVDVFGALFFGKEPANARDAIEKVKLEGTRRWGKWSWMTFFYVAQDLVNLSKRLGIRLRLE